MSGDLRDNLKSLAGKADEDIDLISGALTLALASHPDLSLDKYCHHLEKITKEVDLCHQEFMSAGADDDVFVRLAALKNVLVDTYGYKGDEDAPGHLQNASLIRVIDRGIGLPISLCVLYISVGEALGWNLDGLNIPGHFSCRLEKDGQRLIFSPVDQCKILEAHDIRQFVKDVFGEHAELSADYYEGVGKRDILIILQNHVKLRQIELEDYDGALESVELMQLVDPHEFRLLLDAGVLYARSNQPFKAIDALEEYIKKAPIGGAQQEASLLLQEIKDSL